jgi:DNA-directed RNA polymerase omega subunit
MVRKISKQGSQSPAEIPAEQWPGIDSSFRLIIVAALRAKQLLHGSAPRIHADPLKRRHTSIALEEVKRGLVHFNRFTKDEDGVKSVVS